jgi:hypothetical protein
MIEDSDINKFSAALQSEIRKSIDELVTLGHKARHLVLTDDGTVILNREAVTLEREIEALNRLTPPEL